VKPDTGEIMAASLFVAVLPASAYPFLHAYDNMKMPNWIDTHMRAYTWFGGAPRSPSLTTPKLRLSNPTW